MKEITTTKTITEVTGYEAFDGTRFSSRENCVKYEQSAEAAAKQIAEQYKVSSGYADAVLPGIGNWCEEKVWVFRIKDANARQAVATYLRLVDCYAARNNPVTEADIGKDVAYIIGCDEDWFYRLGTEEDIVEMIRRSMTKTFHPETETNT